MAAETYKKLNQTQQQKIAFLLYTHLKNDEESKESLYTDGYSDERIAAEVGCDLGSVRYRRRENTDFYPLRETKALGDVAALQIRVKNLETKFEKLVQLFSSHSAGKTELFRAAALAFSDKQANN